MDDEDDNPGITGVDYVAVDFQPQSLAEDSFAVHPVCCLDL